MKNNIELNKFKIEIRQALADYISSEGCSCCQSIDRHNKAEAELANLLDVPKYSDGSGYDFSKFETS
jgi:hypothetical protein